MIEMPLEKEVKVKRKIIANFDLRQIIGLIIGIIVGIIAYLIVGLPLEDSVPIFFIGGIVAFGIGYYNKNGLFIETILIKRGKEKIYNNSNRKYRTLNQYATMYNKIYNKMRNDDNNNKKTAKLIKKNQKLLEKKRKNSKVKGYV